MKRRLTIARALINDPELLILDEPTTGLDPQARHLLWERLYRLKQRGATLIITTHYMDEAEQLCDRLVVMDKAKIVAEGSPRQLIDQHSTKEVLELRVTDAVRDSLNGQLEALAERVEELPDRFLLYTADGEQTLDQVNLRKIPVEKRTRSPLEPGGRLPAPDRPLAGRVADDRRRRLRPRLAAQLARLQAPLAPQPCVRIPAAGALPDRDGPRDRDVAHGRQPR